MHVPKEMNVNKDNSMLELLDIDGAVRNDARYLYENEDYVQSANCLFHFMSEADFLFDTLNRKALCPRYNAEDVEFLNIQNDSIKFERLAVLQKCFCDISLRNIFRPFSIELTENNTLTNEEKAKIPKTLTHYDLYGQYAIGFTKKWGEKSKLQPIHYINEKSDLALLFSQSLNTSLSEENLPDDISDAMLNLLGFLKPLRGKMLHRVYDSDNKKHEIEMFKNFHDEKEWRYVPYNLIIDEQPIDGIIANPNITKDSGLLRYLSDKIKDDAYREIWLHFDYDDIRYILVPDKSGRKQLIDTIVNMDIKLFEKENENAEKNMLISKILVLDEIEKDF